MDSIAQGNAGAGVERNPNHPRKGSSIKVEPIRRMGDIRTIKALLLPSPRDLALFTLGINTSLRASELVEITAGMVTGVDAGGDLEIKQRKTGRYRRITLNASCIAATRDLLASRAYRQSDPLFVGQRGPITPIYVNHLVKKWTRMINLEGNYGSHSLRKTWGYHQRVTFNVPAPILMECFGHSTQRQTLAYLCIQDEEVRSVYQNVIG